MKTRFVLAGLVAAVTVTGGSFAQMTSKASSLLDVKASADATVKAVNLTAAAPSVAKSSGASYGKGYMVDFVMDKTSKVSTGKFTLGAMDEDALADPIAKIAKDKCAKLMIRFDVYKKEGSAWTKIFENSIHGDWYETSAPGQVSRCKVKDGSGTAPTISTKPLTMPAGAATDTYRVIAVGGFTSSAWPNNTAEAFATYRPVKITIAQSN